MEILCDFHGSRVCRLSLAPSTCRSWAKPSCSLGSGDEFSLLFQPLCKHFCFLWCCYLLKVSIFRHVLISVPVSSWNMVILGWGRESYNNMNETWAFCVFSDNKPSSQMPAWWRDMRNLTNFPAGNLTAQDQVKKHLQNPPPVFFWDLPTNQAGSLIFPSGVNDHQTSPKLQTPGREYPVIWELWDEFWPWCHPGGSGGHSSSGRLKRGEE